MELDFLNKFVFIWNYYSKIASQKNLLELNILTEIIQYND